MNSRTIPYLVGGFILGLIIGALLIGTSDSLRNDLFGTATNNPEDEQAVVPSSYYQVDFADAREWLTSNLEENEEEPGEALEENLTQVVSLVDATASGDFAQAYADSADAIEDVLNNMRTALLKDDADQENWQVCVGIDNDPYSPTGPKVYLYLQVPEGAEDQLPDEWQDKKLESPREPTLYWSYECHNANEQD